MRKMSGKNCSANVSRSLTEHWTSSYKWTKDVKLFFSTVCVCPTGMSTISFDIASVACYQVSRAIPIRNLCSEPQILRPGHFSFFYFGVCERRYSVYAGRKGAFLSLLDEKNMDTSRHDEEAISCDKFFIQLATNWMSNESNRILR